MCIFLGWLNTYEKYFFFSTKFILNTIINILNENTKYKFIWAEMSFLSLWWDQATIDQKNLLKKLINNRQFEIVTGGWVNKENDFVKTTSNLINFFQVMNDEANTHYFAMIGQLIEGHQFIENKFG